MKTFKLCLSLLALLVADTLVGCSRTTTQSPDVTDSIKNSLDQSGLKDVTVSQDRAKGVVTFGGHVASAGGIEAFERFFSNLPQDAELAFILVPRLEPVTFPARMPELPHAIAAASKRGPYHLF